MIANVMDAIDETPTNFNAQPSGKDWAIGYALGVIFVVGLTVLFIVFSPFQVKPIAGATMISQVTVCNLNQNDCTAPRDFNSVTLPHIDRSVHSAPSRNWLYQLSYTSEMPDETIQALYLPKFSETLQITINGILIDDMPNAALNQTRRWSMPELYILPQNILTRGGNTIEIELTGYKLLGSDFFPVYVGPSEILQTSYDRRYWVTRGLARISIILIAITTIALILLWIFRRRDPVYFWLIICNLFCLITSVAFGFDSLGISFSTRLVWVILSVEVFIFALFMFYLSYIKVSLTRLQRVYFLFIACITLCLLFAPEEFRAIAMRATSLTGFAFGFVIPATIWAFRDRISRPTFTIMFFSYGFMAVLMSHDATIVLFSGRFIHTAMTPFFPIMYLVTVLWLIGTQLLNSLNTSEQLTQTLQLRIDEKTQELDKSYKALAKTQRQQTLDQERQRIMMDLHDGIGGHLVNTIAYMENSQLKDPTLKEALENALRDLSFMIDSLENNDSVTTLLGMYRSRVEPLLLSHGLEFNWQIGDEPVMPKSGPSMNLNLLRIIQEAVTNSIKHSGGNIITVKTDTRSVVISDNGAGFQTEQIERNNDKAGGVGFVSMRRRAKDIGAKIDIEGDEYGTKVTLSW